MQELSAFFESREKFEATVSKLQAKAKFCTIEVTELNNKNAQAKSTTTASANDNNNKSGTPSTFGLKVSVECSQEKIFVNKVDGRSYVLICTNVSSRVQAQDIYTQYKSIDLLPSLWSLFPYKNRNYRFILPRIYLQKDKESMQGLLVLMEIAVLAYQLIFYKDKPLIEAADPSFFEARGSNTDGGDLENLLISVDASIITDLRTGKLYVEGFKGRGVNRYLKCLIGLGKGWSQLTEVDTYKDRSLWGLKEILESHKK